MHEFSRNIWHAGFPRERPKGRPFVRRQASLTLCTQVALAKRGKGRAKR